ncbi:MAG: alpha/beta hydrolase [Polaromonas sp.]|uniref:alpha/beta fold hydrolase n=1 Tax=Polaromonas sp. TaxID=1869339 RepID=UPI0027307423|nr:alpha/beta hydrolase [Polaromonas sp.]MDP2448711.1 alpha/beta hydrolase [Polaromonas sp.]MDP3248647.1 alpha/beta hydrolase [Polaromonas sp.]MDP3825729.1 alpha/beta hydrolase [Polaromonas sp.]
MQRRHFPAFFSALAITCAALAASVAPLTAAAQQRIGVLMLHGKNPGNNQDPNFRPLKATFEREGWLVSLPDMPWSRGRYLEGNWDKAMTEMAAHVKTLRDQGAIKIVIVGHSLGSPAALSHAARGGDANALVLLAPGHIPLGYYTYAGLKVVRDSVDEARALVAAGKGDSRERFSDINQGKQQNVITTAKDFLSYFDPASDAEMSVTAPRVPATTSVMTVVGEKDPLFSRIKAYFVDKLPANPKNKYLEVSGGHLDTPRVASDELVKWIKTVLAD